MCSSNEEGALVVHLFRNLILLNSLSVHLVFEKNV